jgi:hypothetical protein
MLLVVQVETGRRPLLQLQVSPTLETAELDLEETTTVVTLD